MIVVFSLGSSGFFDIVNFQNIIHLSTGAFCGCGECVSYYGGIDLSIGMCWVSSVLGGRYADSYAGGARVRWVLVGVCRVAVNPFSAVWRRFV
jgi:hypothetical protein